MGRMITAIEIEREFGVSAYVVRSAVMDFPLECKKINGFISIDVQDAKKIIFEYHVRQNGITWAQVAKKFSTSRNNKKG